MKVVETFISASVNPRSHCLASCRDRPLAVYASALQLVVQSIPQNDGEIGVIKSVSERRHDKQITTVKRVKSTKTEVFVTGGVDSRVVLWKLDPQLEVTFLSNLEGALGSIGAVCGCSDDQRKVVASAWVSEKESGLRVWWTCATGETTTRSYNIELDHKAFALCLDSIVSHVGSVILAVGTSKRFVELFGETTDNEKFTKLISVAGHTDWIHSIAFNDNLSNLLLVSAGQDTTVRLWSVEKDQSTGKRDVDGETEKENVDVDEDDEVDELTSSKNTFELCGKDGIVSQMRMSSAAVMSGHDDWVHSTSWNREGNVLLTASSDKTCIVWREVDELWRDDVRVGIVGGQAAGFFAAELCSTGDQIVASSYFGGIHAWRAEDEERTFWSALPMTGGHVGEVRDLDWQHASDGTSKFLVSVGQDQTTRVFAPLKGQNAWAEIARPQVHGHDMQCLSVVSPSSFVSGAEEKIFRAFRAPKSFVTSLETISGVDVEKAFGSSKLAEYGACVPALGLSNKSMGEGETIGGEHWEEEAFRATPTTFKSAPTEDALQQNTLWPEEHKLYGHGYEVYAVAVNPTGKVLATACKSSHVEHSVIMLWNVDDWSKKAEISGHQLTATQIAWNRNGSLMLSVSRDRTAKLYKETNDNVNGFDYSCVWTSQKQHSRIIWACDWFEDDTHFVTVGRDQKVIVWQASQGSSTTEAAPVATVKLAAPATAVAVSNGSLCKATIVVGLQTGELIVMRVTENSANIDIVGSYGKNPIQIDAPVLRLRFSRSFEKDGRSTQYLAMAGTDAKLKVLDIEY